MLYILIYHLNYPHSTSAKTQSTMGFYWFFFEKYQLRRFLISLVCIYVGESLFVRNFSIFDIEVNCSAHRGIFIQPSSSNSILEYFNPAFVHSISNRLSNSWYLWKFLKSSVVRNIFNYRFVPYFSNLICPSMSNKELNSHISFICNKRIEFLYLIASRVHTNHALTYKSRICNSDSIFCYQKYYIVYNLRILTHLWKIWRCKFLHIQCTWFANTYKMSKKEY